MDFKVGDRVRVVIEGETRHSTSKLDQAAGRFILLHGGQAVLVVDPMKEYVKSVEKITPPLPTTPGSVIRSGIGKYVRVRVKEGWINPSRPNDGPFLDYNYAGDYTVIFDAGAE